MFRHVVELIIPNVTAESVYDLMINPIDEWYQKWLPNEHWAFHIVKKGQDNHAGDLIYYDEILGTKKYRLTFYAMVTTADRPNRIAYQMRKFGLNLPGYLDCQFTDVSGGVALKHEVRIGWRGFGVIIDPIIKLFFNKAFYAALEGHCEREWSCLADIINGVV